MPDEITPEERAKALLAKLAGPAPVAPKPEQIQWDPELIPDPGNDTGPQRDTRLQSVLDSIGITEAYIRFIGKMIPDVSRRRTEGVMISCPFPEHRDSNPSAWMNTEKGTWFCGGCQKGGDKFDLAAIGLNYNLNTYKTDGSFPRLAREMAENFGYTIVKGTNETYAVKADPQPDPQPVNSNVSPLGQPKPPGPIMGAPVALASPLGTPVPITPVIPSTEPTYEADQDAKVIQLFKEDMPQDDADEIAEAVLASRMMIPWEDIAIENSFLREWMLHTTIDDLPHEFYFWLGLQALGFVGGSDTILLDYKPVKPNLYVCLYGKTGQGKSRATDPYLRLIKDVFPYSQDPKPTGVKILSTPNSAEFLIDQFAYEVKDPNGPVVREQVKGLVRYDEMSALISKSFGKGSSLRETIIELFDVYESDVTTGSRGSGTSRAHNPFAQMLSTTQPNAIHAFLRKTDVESGFLNRWVYAAGKARVAPISYGGIMQDITSPSVHLRTTAAWAMNGHKYSLEGDAYDAWHAFFERELSRFRSGQQDMESIVSRVDLILKKIIVLLCLNEHLDQPTGEVVERAIMLYPYLKATYSVFSSDIIFDEETECQQQVIYTIKRMTAKMGKYPSKNDVWRNLNKKYTLKMVNNCFKFMVDMGLLQEHVPAVGQRGRPTLRYEYVGSV